MLAGQDGGTTVAEDSSQTQMRKHKGKGKESSHRHKSSKSARFQNAWAGSADLEGGEEVERSVQGEDFSKSAGNFIGWNHPCGLIKCRFLNSGDTAIKDYGRGFPFPLSMWVSKRMKIAN